MMRKAIAETEGSWSGSTRSQSILENAIAVEKKSEDWEIDWRLLKIGEKIATGSCGDLYRGVYHGQDVAVKVLRSEHLNNSMEVEFAQEVAILRQVHHENVVRFIGACTKLPNLCIVTEFMPGGSLYEYLHKNHIVLKLPHLLKCAIDVCKGMEYLHQKNVIHGDLKTANLLMDTSNVVKVADFGVARFQNSGGVMTAETDTYRWMAPEVINHQPYDQKSDVFSFAIVLWELVTSKVPYDNMTPLQAALGVRQGLRPELPKNEHPKILDLMQRCWEALPSNRPSFSAIRVELEELTDSSPFNSLPQDTLHQIFCHLPLRQIAAAKCVCKTLHSYLSSPSFLHVLRTQSNPLPLLALKPSHRHASTHPTLHAFDPASSHWLKFSLSFLPFSSLHPITSSNGLLYLWASNPPRTTLVQNSQKALVVCNPLTGLFKILPQLGSAWSRHGSVLAGSLSVVLVLTELAILYYSENPNFNPNFMNNWLKFSSNLPSKPRSPVFVSDFILTLCDVGSPWRSQWAMFKAKIVDMDKTMQWVRLEKREWGDIFDILKRPRLVKAGNDRKVYMVGGLKSSYAIQSSCTTILILRLDLESLEWEEAGRMPVEMYRCFMESGKFKVFGGGNRVCFSAKRVGRLALWEEGGDGKTEWRWVDGVPGSGDGLCRGFVFEARLDAVP